MADAKRVKANLPPWTSRLGVDVRQQELPPPLAGQVRGWNLGLIPLPFTKPYIAIDPDSEIPIEQLIVHEMTHIGQVRRFRDRAKLTGAIIATLLQGKNPLQDIQYEKDAYAMQNRARARAEAEVEARSKALGLNRADLELYRRHPDMWRRLQEYKRSVHNPLAPAIKKPKP